MTKRLLLCIALFLAVITEPLYPQSTTGNGAADSQQNPSVDCADPQNAAGEECAQSQSGAPGQTQRQTPDLYTIRPINRSTSAASENGALNGQADAQAQQRTMPLPPDPPTEFQKFVAATTGQLLPIYGANLFRNVPTTFAPNDLAPVTSSYVIGPDDQLRVRIWGQINYSGNLRVDRSGDIYLAQVGTVHVAGLQFSALDLHLREAVARIYRNFDLSVDIGQIRSMQIYVTGQARRPGVYTVSSLSSLVDTLFASGGPSPQGSLRHILLNRDGKTIADFDLYALLIHGDKSQDVHLLPEDVLYIPAAGRQVAITGSIRVPGIYELREGETIGNLIEAAGKATALSSSARISLERVGTDQLRQAMEFAFDASGLTAPLADGDILRIYSILPAYQKTVTLRGNVANPGRFSFRPGMHLSDLIPDKDSLMSRDYWWRRSHLGLPSPEFEPSIYSIARDPRTLETSSAGFTASVTPETLTSALTPHNPQADRNDPAGTGQNKGNGSIASRNQQTPASGSEGQPKRNEVNLLSPEIDWNYAVIERVDPETLKTSLIQFDLGKLVINHDASQDLALQPGDTITIFSQTDIHVPLDQQTKYVDLEGEFEHSGIYSVQPGETLRDLVRRAGGFTTKAYLYGSEFDRETTRVLQQQRLDEYVNSLTMETERGTQALAISGTSNASSSSDVNASRIVGQDLIARLSQIRATGRIVFEVKPDRSNIVDVPAIGLENGDRFDVPPVPATVNVVGAVYNQNSFLYQSGRSVNYYLKKAGGANRNADWRRSFIIRADGSVISRTSVRNLGAWSKSFDELRLNAGDTVVVPDKTLRPNGLRALVDWTQIFSQLALGAAAINIF